LLKPVRLLALHGARHRCRRAPCTLTVSMAAGGSVDSGDSGSESDSSPSATGPCPVCDGTGCLLDDTCPLCGDAGPGSGGPYICEICGKDLQSATSLAEHLRGRRHRQEVGVAEPPLAEKEFFERLAAGEFRRIVICTGAGVSTAAGIPDFRSEGGLFEEIRACWGARFPEVQREPENLLSRNFARSRQDVWEAEVQPWLRSLKWADAAPTATHHFCGWLHRQGWLRRVYTQNVDGLHVHEEVGLPAELVVECHGALRDGSLVLYGDSLPERFERCCREDFLGRPSEGEGVDLLMVFGTSLQVAPFCGVPNMAPRGCARVLVNRSLADCMVNPWTPRPRRLGGCYSDRELGGLGAPAATMPVGGRKSVSLRPLWQERRACRRWRQLLVETSCDAFVADFFESAAALSHGRRLRE